ncbi:hypothetical protein KV102_06075 [Mumia sp. zg.B53]|uniref:hypothetical protein n=1 Tax=unclassified Mumia TaxID=2621872 RepID=UPI001C6ED9C1|nr:MULTISPECIES: hypothetical protein [unclassified Mumia]MBW9209804.1 hypothetical protein [Mumia sp. zg.B21]MBW9214407.1 hypothetical protein [Mumia sp. zg.B53]MDD9350518.1 hypothetical protein [Mumia sp.]
MLDAYFRETPLSGIGVVLALLLATTLAAVALRTGTVSPLRVWLYAAALGSYAAVTMMPGALDQGWRWVSPLGLHVDPPRWDALLTGIDSRSLNVWAGLALGASAVLLSLELRQWWPSLVVLAAPWLVEWWQAVMPTARDGLSGEDVGDNLYGIAVGAVIGLLLHAGLVLVERRAGTHDV